MEKKKKVKKKSEKKDLPSLNYLGYMHAKVQIKKKIKEKIRQLQFLTKTQKKKGC